MAFDRRFKSIRWHVVIYIFFLYLGSSMVFFAGYSTTAFITFFLWSYMKGFGTTGGFHRYFSHKSFRTNRIFQFFLGLLGTMAAQGSIFSWTAVHRLHHKHSDSIEDIISPVQFGILWTQFAGWSLYPHPWENEKIQDFSHFNELKILDENWFAIALSQVPILYIFGESLSYYFPNLQTSGLQLVVWGFFISTVYNYNLIGFVNGYCHKWGSKPFMTSDNSRNNFWVAILTMGEGWHNNHHRFPYSERQGLAWWQIDFTHYILVVFSWFGWVWEMKTASIQQEEGK